ncbi:MAG TPA: hypothetical protein VGA02_00020 [Gemmatimonadales bacterium]|jgi:hypothetical protein
MTQPVPDQTPGDRRSGVERRVVVLPFPAERRRARERRNGGDRRTGDLDSRDHLRLALEHVIRAAEDGDLDDETLRRVDNVLLRLWALLETRGP